MKGLLRLALRSAWARRFTLGLMVISIALSTLLILGAERLRHDVRRSFSQALTGTDLIVGARGSATQLVLHSVFHLGQAVQPVSLERIESISKMPQVSWVVPIALGDTLRGFPVVATDAQFLKHIQVGDRQSLRLAHGAPFGAGLQAVLGSGVAQTLGLRVGDTLNLSHGGDALGGNTHDEHPFVVSGVLAASGSPIDRSVLISLESMQTIHAGWVAGMRPRGPARSQDASLDSSATSAARPRTVSAAFVGLHNRAAVFSVQRALQSAPGEPLTAALPGVTLDELWSALGNGEAALRLLTGLVALASLAGLVSVIMAGLDARRRELAVLRSVGATPLALTALLVFETLFACIAGLVIGLLLGAIAIALAASPVQASFGIQLSTGLPSHGEWLLMGAVLLAGMLSGLLPAWRACRLSLADGLSPRS